MGGAAIAPVCGSSGKQADVPGFLVARPLLEGWADVYE